MELSNAADGPLTVLLAGLGGQGVVRAGEVLAEAALRSGLDVKTSEIHGLSRRFGSVSCQVRIGEDLLSPLAGHGMVDILLALEIQEGLRYLPYLKPSGTALMNRLWVAADGSRPSRMPDELEELADPRSLWVDGDQVTHEFGNPKGLNFYMLGAASMLLPVSKPAWIQACENHLKPKDHSINLALFATGRRAVRRRLQAAAIG
jgi:indolepyruvate ferredoxin oxidoreductase beta subunit